MVAISFGQELQSFYREMAHFFGQVQPHEKKVSDEMVERVAALRHGSVVNGNNWLEQEVNSLTVAVLRQVCTSSGLASTEGGRSLAKAELVTEIMAEFLPEVGWGRGDHFVLRLGLLGVDFVGGKTKHCSEFSCVIFE